MKTFESRNPVGATVGAFGLHYILRRKTQFAK